MSGWTLTAGVFVFGRRHLAVYSLQCTVNALVFITALLCQCFSCLSQESCLFFTTALLFQSFNMSFTGSVSFLYNYPFIITLFSVSHGQRRAPPCTRLKRVVFFEKKTTPLRIPQKKLFSVVLCLLQSWRWFWCVVLATTFTWIMLSHTPVFRIGWCSKEAGQACSSCCSVELARNFGANLIPCFPTTVITGSLCCCPVLAVTVLPRVPMRCCLTTALPPQPRLRPTHPPP